MDNTKKSLPSVLAKRKVVVLLLGAVVVMAIIAQLSDRTTARYWNDVYALAQQADAAKNMETPAEVIAILVEIERQLAGLDRNGVDPRALDTTNRFGVALAAARLSVESGQYLIDHPVRTALKSTATLVGGRGPFA